MLVHFYKYHGTGNDFIIIDNRQLVIQPDDQELIKKLCTRRLGIGADGMMLLSGHDTYDFEMKYFNADGFEGSLCGNGARCISAFAHKEGIAGDTLRFKAFDGVHEASIEKEKVTVRMNDVTSIEQHQSYFILDTGSPHSVFFRDDVETMNVVEEGQKMRFNDQFMPEGINVNFVQKEGNKIFVRTFERGVEDETLSCGTGVVAASICTVLVGGIDKLPVSIRTRGGDLDVDFTMVSKSEFTDIKLSGSVCFSFQGDIEI